MKAATTKPMHTKPNAQRDSLSSGRSHDENEIPTIKRSTFIFPVDVLQKAVSDDEEVGRMLGLFLATSAGANLLNQFQSGLIDQDEYILRRRKLFGNFIEDLNTKAGF